MRMKRLFVMFAVVSATLLSIFYLMTARVYLEGSLGESYLMLKPHPSIELELGGGEEGAWSRANPGRSLPWWQSDKAVKLAWGGDWEDPVFWTSFYTLGYFLTPLIWCALVILLMWPQKSNIRVSPSL